MRKVGIFGGSFDPVHLGHIGLAMDAAKQAELDRVIFIPTKIQPFKQDKKATSGEDRFRMLQIATEGIENFEVSDYELNEDRVSYTYLTMRAMRRMLGEDTRLYFITGTDSFLKIDTWMNAHELLSDYAFIVGTRPGYKQEELKVCIDRIRRDYNTEVKNIANVQIDVSSTEIRALLAAGQPAKGLIPDGVERYIRAHGIYEDPSERGKYDDIKSRIKICIEDNLTQRRLEHTYSVVEEAKKLALRYGEDVEKAELAALFHDMFRSAPAEVLNRYIEQFGLPNAIIDNPNLSHGKIAAEVMKRDYGVSDADMINAVAFHTTGRAGMSRLEKIVFLADAIEPHRDYPSVAHLRELAYCDLDQACIESLQGTVAYVEASGSYLDPDTRNALNDLKEKLDL